MHFGGGHLLVLAHLQRRWSSTLFRKISVYFLLRRWEIWRSRGSVSHDAVRGVTGRWPERPVCCQCLALLGLSTGRTASDARCSLFVRLVWSDLTQGCLTESTRHSECVRWCVSGVSGFCNPLCARVR